MHSSTLLSSLALLSATGWAGYVLEDDYMSGNFFDQFSFFDGPDPTNGFVAYQSQANCESQNLISGGTGGSASFGVDNTTQTPNGRPSVRLTSNKSYQSGQLIVLDVSHMPGGICGTWPAFWTVGPDWPNQGEIDIIEGVNDQNANDMTLHTGPGCTIGGGSSTGSSNAFSGSVVSTNCVSGNGDNQGCQIATQDTTTYGTQFNSNGGGVYAMEWTDSAISMYFFPRGSVPNDVLGDSPDPSSWSEPLATFSGGCDFGTAFTNQQIVFDTTFCGDWAGQVWSGSSCASSTGSSTCEDFVANNPDAFAEAYWTVNGLKVYQSNGGSSPAPSGSPSSAPAPSGAPSSAPAPSSFATSPSVVPAPSGSAPGWPAPSGAPSGAPSAVPSAAPSAPPSAAPSAAPTSHAISNWSGQPGWPASQTWGGSSPWQSGGNWNEVQNPDGSFSVGRPVQGNVVTNDDVKREAESVVVDVRRIHSRHLAKHRRHGARHGGAM